MTSPYRTLGTSIAAAAGLGLAGLAYAGLVERNLFTLRRFDLPVLPPGATPVRVLQVADIHLVPGQERKIAWIRSLARLEPDLVVNTGDNLSHHEAVPHVLRALAPLLDRPGLFVLGSNDRYAPIAKNPALYLTSRHAAPRPDRARLPTAELVAGMTAAGWTDLDNARTSLTLAGQRLDFVGVDDPHIQRDRYTAVAGAADPDAALTVGVVHAPYQRILDAMTADGVALVIAGHTHGGQLAIPAYGALVTNCDLDRSRAKGVSRWWPGAGVATPDPSAGPVTRTVERLRPYAGAQPSSAAPDDAAYLHVSAGLGTSRYAPVRFACRPEASLLTLVPRPT